MLNAGRSLRAEFETCDIEVDRDLFELNVFSQVNLATILVRHFIEWNQGHVVVMSSTAGKAGAPGARCYAASKHALHVCIGSFRVRRVCLQSRLDASRLQVNLL